MPTISDMNFDFCAFADDCRRGIGHLAQVVDPETLAVLVLITKEGNIQDCGERQGDDGWHACFLSFPVVHSTPSI
jgi:hypothetical protein